MAKRTGGQILVDQLLIHGATLAPQARPLPAVRAGRGRGRMLRMATPEYEEQA